MNPLLLKRARNLLADASRIAEAPGVSFIPKGDRQYSSTGSTTGPTTGAGGDTFGHFVARFAKCKTDRDLEGFIEALQSELDAIRKRPKVPEVKFKQRVVWDWIGTDYKTVAKLMQTSTRSVRRWREEAGLDPNTGERRAA